MTSPLMKQHERFDWSFGSIPTATAEFRQAHALEYIAYYLDRIEGHIAKISKTSTDNVAGDITQDLIVSSMASSAQDIHTPIPMSGKGH